MSLTLTLVASVLAALPVAAGEQELEEIIVIGSRIPRPDYEAASPVVTVPAERFEQTSAATVEAILGRYPQFANGTNATSNNSGLGGQAFLNLRGLGPEATLVLVDGRRLVPANGWGVPDVNVIPPSLVERVEILSGGAAAVYGTDALAGVVNFHLAEQIEGFEFAGNWAQTEHGDGGRYTATLTGGTRFADGRGSIMGAVGYMDRSLVTEADRKFSRVQLEWVGPGTDGVGPGGQFLPVGAPVIGEGRAMFMGNRPDSDAFAALFETYGYPAGTVPYPQNVGFNTDGTLFTQGNFEPGSVANFRGIKDPYLYNDGWHSFNQAPWTALQMPLERISVFGSGSFEFDTIGELYAQVIYADYSVKQQVWPVWVNRLFVPVTNPYIPPDLKFLLDARSDDPEAPFRFDRRFVELGSRIGEHDYRFYQAAVGLRGTLFSDWQYNGYIQYGQNDEDWFGNGNIRISKFEELLWAPDGGLALCGGANPFGLNSLSAECARYASVDLHDTGKTQQLTTEFSLTGSPLELPAGTLDTVFGVFYQKNQYERRPDPAERVMLPDGRPDVPGFSNVDVPMKADDYNLDAYVEALVPLLTDRPGAKSLRTVFGYRWSDYASAGNTSTYKAELLYEPVDPVHVRASFQHAVRAPALMQRYFPQVAQLVPIPSPDPCSFDSEQRTGPDGAAVTALCLAQGIPSTEIDVFNDYSGVAPGFAGGNPDLIPEKGRTWTVGVVLDSLFNSPALSNLQVALDWWDIDITDAIVRYSADAAVYNCYDPAYNPGFSASNRYCTWFAREPGSGYIVDAHSIDRNIAGSRASGVDLQLSWHMPVGAGELGAAWVQSWPVTYEWQDDPEAPKMSFVGRVGIPRWKWNLDVNYRVGGLALVVNWSYVGHADGAWQREPSFQVPVKNYVDLTAGYEFGAGALKGLTLQLGVDNALDEGPPIFPAHGSANTDGGSYDVLGRTYWLSLSYAVRPGG